MVEAWQAVSSAPATLLDLKNNSPAAIRQVSILLAQHRGTHRVYISTPNLSALRQLQKAAPATTRLLTVSTPRAVAALLQAGRLEGINGVSIKDSLLTPAVVRSLRQRDLLVQSYTVNRMSRVNQLSSWGVTGVTTDDLTIAGAVHASQWDGSSAPDPSASAVNRLPARALAFAGP